VVVDVTGYFVPGSSGSTFVPLNPARVLDSRFGTGLSGSFLSNSPRTLTVAGAGGVPFGATAVTGNLVAVVPGSNGYLAIAPGVTATPGASNLNVLQADTRGAGVTVKLDTSGRVGIVWKGSPGARTHVVFDVTGYFVDGGSGAEYFPLDGARVLDSRFGNGLAGPFVAKVTRTVQATGRGTVPVNAVAVTGSAAVVLPTAGGWLIVGPGGSPLGSTATINLPKGDIRANGLTSRAGPGGGVAIVFQGASGSTTNVVLDVMGYFR
jgi:hypothetical protein